MGSACTQQKSPTAAARRRGPRRPLGATLLPASPCQIPFCSLDAYGLHVTHHAQSAPTTPKIVVRDKREKCMHGVFSFRQPFAEVHVKDGVLPCGVVLCWESGLEKHPWRRGRNREERTREAIDWVMNHPVTAEGDSPPSKLSETCLSRASTILRDGVSV